MSTARRELIAHSFTLAGVLFCMAIPGAELGSAAAKPQKAAVDPSQTAGLEILTPTKGADFKDYMAVATKVVRQNWFALMPESARNGVSGKVIIRFHVQRNGTIDAQETSIETSSGRDDLDRAAMAAVRSSVPFRPLPAAFHGQAIELRGTFLYNPATKPHQSVSVIGN